MRALVAAVGVALLLNSSSCGEAEFDPRNSVVSVTTPASEGTGVAIVAGFVVTDAHVVWPAEFANISLGDGRQFRAVVVGFDRQLDLAVLALPGAAIAEVDPIPIASTITTGEGAFHLGLKQTSDGIMGFTEATGVVTEQRRIAEIDATFVATDASGTAGLSGGPVLNTRGELLGITQFQVASTEVYALSASDSLEASTRLIENWDADSPVELRLVAPGATTLSLVLDEPRAHEAYVVQGAPDGFDLELTGTSDAPLELALVDVHGHLDQVIQTDGSIPLGLRAAVPGNEVRLIILRLMSPAVAHVDLQANTQLRRLADEDHVTELVAGSAVRGVLDYPSDIDVYELELPAKGISLVRLTSVTFDPILQIELVDGEMSLPVAVDDNGGSGLFGRDASIQFTAPRSALYRLVIGDAGGGVGHAGGYVLSVSTPFIDR